VKARRQDADRRDEEHRDRHRLGRRAPEGIEIDEKRIVSSTGALRSKGAGEAAGGRRRRDRARARLGVAPPRRAGDGGGISSDRILPGMDGEVGKQFQRILQKQGMTFKLSTRSRDRHSGKTLKASVEPAAAAAAETIEADVALIAIGRVPYTEGSVSPSSASRWSAAASPTTHFATNVAGIYAIGDVIAGPMLAHKAEDEASRLPRSRRPGRSRELRRDPERDLHLSGVASVGKTEEELKAAGIAYTSASFRSRRTAAPRSIHHRRLREDPRRRQDRPRARRAHRRRRCRHDDLGGHGRDGVRRLGRGHRAHLPPAPDAVRGREGSSPRGGKRAIHM
jgi:hypothetical protein